MHMNCSSGGPVLPSNGSLNNLEPLFVLDKHQLEVEPSWLPSSNHRKPVCTEMKLKGHYRKAGSKEKMKKVNPVLVAAKDGYIGCLFQIK